MRRFLITAGQALMIMAFVIPLLIGIAMGSMGSQGTGYAVVFALVGFLPLMLVGAILKIVGERMKDTAVPKNPNVVVGVAVLCAFIIIGALVALLVASGGSGTDLLYTSGI